MSVDHPALGSRQELPLTEVYGRRLIGSRGAATTDKLAVRQWVAVCLAAAALCSSCGSDEPESCAPNRGKLAAETWKLYSSLCSGPSDDLELHPRLLDRRIRSLRSRAELQSSATQLNDLAVRLLQRSKTADRFSWEAVEALELLEEAATLESSATVELNLTRVRQDLGLWRSARISWGRFRSLYNGMEASVSEKTLSIANLLPEPQQDGSGPDREHQSPLDAVADLLERRLSDLWAGGKAGLEAAQTSLPLIQDLDGFLDSCRSAPCLSAHEALLAALSALESGQTDTAAFAANEAVDLLSATGSPAVLVAKLLQAKSTSFSDTNAALDLAAVLVTEIDRTPYRSLAGEAHWTLGMALGASLRHREAIAHYKRGLEHFEAIGLRSRGRLIGALLAQELWEAGDFVGAWNTRLQGLRTLESTDPVATSHAILSEAFYALLREGYLRSSLVFANELRRADNAAFLEFYTILRHVAALLALDRWEEAATEMADALAIDSREGFSRDAGIENLLKAYQSEVLKSSDPLESRRLATEALAHFETTGHLDEVEKILLTRSGASEEIGDLASRNADLTKLLNINERRRRLLGRSLRVSSLLRSQKAVDELVESNLASQDVRQALNISEAYRARYLLDLEPANGEPLGAEDLIRALPSGTALLVYHQTSESVIGWGISKQGVRSFLTRMQPDDRDALHGYPEALRRSPSLERKQSRQLYNLLIHPFEFDFDQLDRLLVVPDRALFRVPFSALTDPSNGKRLIESIAVARSPSATLALSGRRAEASRRALVVAQPLEHAGAFRELEPLPHAAREAKIIRGLYEQTSQARSADSVPLLEAASGVGIFHFAGHSIETGGSLRDSGLVVSSGNDVELLSVEDLPEGFSAPGVVFLSSCRSTGGFRADREGVIGVANAFFAHGSTAVVGTLSEVDDRDSVGFAEDFHLALISGLRPSNALRAAALARIDESPEMWANYVILEKSYAEGN